MGINDYNKAREVMTRVHEFLSNLCRDAKCDDHCSECIDASDLADDVYDLIHAPPRNCDVGTAEEQVARFHDTGEPYHTLTLRNALTWAQKPYKEGENNGSK